MEILVGIWNFIKKLFGGNNTNISSIDKKIQNQKSGDNSVNVQNMNDNKQENNENNVKQQ